MVVATVELRAVRFTYLLPPYLGLYHTEQYVSAVNHCTTRLAPRADPTMISRERLIDGEVVCSTEFLYSWYLCFLGNSCGITLQGSRRTLLSFLVPTPTSSHGFHHLPMPHAHMQLPQAATQSYVLWKPEMIHHRVPCWTVQSAAVECGRPFPAVIGAVVGAVRDLQNHALVSD